MQNQDSQTKEVEIFKGINATISSKLLLVIIVERTKVLLLCSITHCSLHTALCTLL